MMHSLMVAKLVGELYGHLLLTNSASLSLTESELEVVIS